MDDINISMRIHGECDNSYKVNHTDDGISISYHEYGIDDAPKSSIFFGSIEEMNTVAIAMIKLRNMMIEASS